MIRDFKEVFKELGSEQRLEAVLTEFYEALSQDILVGFFFEKKDLNTIIQKQKSFLLKAMGINQSYSGRSPKAAHENLAPILSGHFDRRLLILRKVLQDFGLTSEAIESWVAFEETFRKGIVQLPKST